MIEVFSNGDNSELVSVKLPKGCKPQMVSLGIYELTLKDFLKIVEEVLTGSNLEENDERVEFLRRIKSASIEEGFFVGLPDEPNVTNIIELG